VRGKELGHAAVVAVLILIVVVDLVLVVSAAVVTISSRWRRTDRFRG